MGNLIRIVVSALIWAFAYRGFKDWIIESEEKRKAEEESEEKSEEAS